MNPHEKYLEEFEDRGFTILPQVLDLDRVARLREELDCAMKEDLRNRPDVFDAGMVHNLMTRGDALAEILDHAVMDDFVGRILGPTYILYAYQSSSLPPSGSNYGNRIHVDSPRFIPNYCTNVGVIFPLDDFTEENGATHILPGGHRKPEVSAEEFDADSERVLCKRGDMIVFHARSWHRAGTNRTSVTRHAITLNMCRSYMRQRFDYPRLMGAKAIATLGERGQRLLGMNVRMPTSLDEFYLPEAERLYKPNQG